jgi:hypothetical protein
LSDNQTYSQTLDRILAQTPPPRLYHYTSAKVLLEIVRNREVWASNLLYVNDAKELTYAADCVQEAVNDWVRGFLKDHDDFDPRYRDDVFLNLLPGAVESIAGRVHAFSLSQEEDLLSQWRAYCPDKGGYSIGFPTSQLLSMAAKQRFRLTPCTYDEGVAIAIDWVDAFWPRYRTKVDAGKNHGLAASEAGYEFAMHVARFGAILKHPAFREEREWRLISDFVEAGDPSIDFRPRVDGVVPFLHFRLADDQDTDLVRADGWGGGTFSVCVGPTNNAPAARAAVESLLRKYLPGAEVHESIIPYRSVAS